MYKYVVTIETGELCGFFEHIEVELPELVDIDTYDWLGHPDVEFAAHELVLAEEQNRMMGETDEDGVYDEDEDPADVLGNPSTVSLKSVELIDENNEVIESRDIFYSATLTEVFINHEYDDLKELIMTNSGIKL